MADQKARGEQDVEIMAEAGNPALCDIRVEWDWVKPGIEEILSGSPQLTFRPEDVYAACMSQQAALWCAPEGFVVTTAEVDEFTGDRTLLIWLAWAREKGQNCALKYYSFFAQGAKREGFKNIEVRSAVPQMENYLLSNGWQKDTVVYTREL